MGDYETGALASVESSLKYHFCCIVILTRIRISGPRTVLGGLFDWGGRLLICNGGALRFPQRDWKPRVECKGIRELDCETDMSSRCESRA